MLSHLGKYIRRSFNGIGIDICRLHPTEDSTEKNTQSAPRDLILPKVSVSSLLNGDTSVKMLEPEHIYGNVSLMELLVLNTLVAQSLPKMLFEIGTFDGRSTLNITANASPCAQTFTLDLAQNELSTTAYALDVNDWQYAGKQVSDQRFINTRWERQILRLFGDSAKFDFTPYFGKMGFVFIDGSHAYDYAKSDSEVALRLVTSPAFIVWHDYQPFWMGVVECLEELYLSGGAFAGLKHIEGTSLAFLAIGTSIIQ
jgi:hypothetical protein